MPPNKKHETKNTTFKFKIKMQLLTVILREKYQTHHHILIFFVFQSIAKIKQFLHIKKGQRDNTEVISFTFMSSTPMQYMALHVLSSALSTPGVIPD